MKNIVLTIGREYGSGGRYIGEMVSKKLNIPLYDRVLIEKAYEKIGGNYSKIDEYEEVVQNKFLKNLFIDIDISLLKIHIFFDLTLNKVYRYLPFHSLYINKTI